MSGKVLWQIKWKISLPTIALRVIEARRQAKLPLKIDDCSYLLMVSLFRISRHAPESQLLIDAFCPTQRLSQCEVADKQSKWDRVKKSTSKHAHGFVRKTGLASATAVPMLSPP